MKKNMKLVVLIIGAVVLVAAILTACIISTRNKQVVVAEPVLSDNIDSNAPLLALVDTKEEAESIAELYDIEFLHFTDGVATYYTDKDLAEIIAKSNEGNNSKLYINYKRTINNGMSIKVE